MAKRRCLFREGAESGRKGPKAAAVKNPPLSPFKPFYSLLVPFFLFSFHFSLFSFQLKKALPDDKHRAERYLDGIEVDYFVDQVPFALFQSPSLTANKFLPSVGIARSTV